MSRRPWRTIRFRITAAALGAALVVLGVTAAVLVREQRSQLIDQTDADIAAQVQQLAASVARTGVPDALPVLGDDTVVQFVAADGTIVLQSEDLLDEQDDDGSGASVEPIVAPGSVAFDDRDPDEIEEGDDIDDAQVQDARLPDGDPARAAALAVTTADGPVTVIVARSEIDVEDSVEALASTLFLVVPAAALLLAATTWVLVGRTLRPVDGIRRRVSEIGADDLAKRVPEPGSGDEIDRLALTMNQMLDRLERASERERQFVSDASHELRSPLTRMRAALEVDRDHPSTADPAATSASVLDEVVGMELLVGDLLDLAAGDASAGARAPVDLDVVVDAVLATTEPPASVYLERGDVAPVQVSGDERALQRLLRNLVDNAIRHATSTVTVDLREAIGHAVLVIADDGPGIAPADRERVFERFVRLDDARTAGAGGTGLGLAIVRAIATRHGGTVAAGERDGGGTTMTVRLPAA